MYLTQSVKTNLVLSESITELIILINTGANLEVGGRGSHSFCCPWYSVKIKLSFKPTGNWIL